MLLLLRPLILILLTLFSYAGYTQEVVTEFEGADSSVEGFATVTVGDSILILGKYKSAIAAPLQLWLNKITGEVRPLDIPELSQKSICGITRSTRTVNFYYYTQSKKSVLLNVLELDRSTGQKIVDTIPLRTDMRLLGSYVDGKLKIVFSSPRTFSIRIFEVDGNKLDNEKIFQVPNDLFVSKDPFVFFPKGVTPRKHEALSLKKIYQNDSSLVITVDEPFEEYNEKRKTFKTTYVNLNLVTGKTIIKFFMETQRSPFSTFVHHNLLYRRLDNKNEMDVFDLSLGKKVSSFSIPFESLETVEQVVRDGEKGFIEKRQVGKPLYFFRAAKGFVNVEEDQGRTVLMWGWSQEAGSGLFGPGPFALIGGLAMTIVRDIKERNLIAYQYFDLAASRPDHVVPAVSSLNKRVDEYELSRFAGMRLNLKAYAEDASYVYAFYLRPKTSKIIFVRFNKLLD